MSREKMIHPTLIVVLTILGVLAIAFAAGLVLMQTREIPGTALGSALSSRQISPETDDFDPISWAREGVAYPPLLETETEEESEDLFTDYDGDQAIPGETEPEIPRPVEAVRKPVAVNPPRAASKAPSFRKVTENAYWVQVFSSADSSRAEAIREDLAAQGLPSSVQAREVNGKLRYRIRLGAFEGENEAEHYAETVRRIPGYESSYVVIAPVTRRIPFLKDYIDQ